MGRTAIYARISDDRQEGAGVERQLQDCRARVKRERWGPAEELVDNDLSAFSGKPRPSYTKLLAAVRSGEVTRIVVYHLDRLYRRPRELEDLIDLADRGQVQVVTCSGDIDLATDNGITMARVLVAIANQESRDKSRRVKRAKQQAREQGKPHGGPRAFGWKDGTNPHPGEAARLNEAVADLLAGVSLADVARRWNAAGVSQPQTGRANWTADVVRQVVSNPRHAGLIGHRVEVRPEGVAPRYARPVAVGEAKWPAIIERSRWEQLQVLLAQRGANGHVPRLRSLLTGLVTCGKCGATMVRTGSRSGQVTRKVWRCPSYNGCGKVSIDATGLEALLRAATFQRVGTRALVDLVSHQARASESSKDLIRELQALERRIDAAAGSYAAGKLGLREWEKASAAMQTDQATLQRRLAALTSSSQLQPYAGHPGLLEGKWEQLSVDQQREIIHIALGSVTVSSSLTLGRPTFDPDRVDIGKAAKVRKRR